jgi:L-threonylcarbamoyladenylate synthase
MELSAQINEAVRILKGGGVVAYPTDTVYGLGASMDCPEAVERVFAVKSRPRSMALPVLVGSVAQIEALAGRITPAARCLIRAFLPGAMTLVLPASGLVPDYLRAREGTLALRIPDHAVPLALIEGIGTGIVGTSANLSGMPSPVTSGEVRSQLGDRVDLIIEGGGCGGRESTIVDATGETPRVLRSGAVGREEIERVCGQVMAGNGG